MPGSIMRSVRTGMALQLRWVGEDELERVADTRAMCFGHAPRDFERYRQSIRTDPRAKAGDFLLAEENGGPVGTSTSLSMTMWVRGSPVPCQGVAFVGTIKTHRRRSHGGDGVATQLMRETLRKARERGDIVSALMPFRASFYEHFGYGLVERRNDWTAPLSIFPSGATGELRFYRPDDMPELASFRQRVIQNGQCEIERTAATWDVMLKRGDNGFAIVDRPQVDGPVRGYLWMEQVQVGARNHIQVRDILYQDVEALKRQLHFLASLRDQYSAALLTLPSDLPLQRLLREAQLPHRPVEHAVPELRQTTRLQLRVLDHKRVIEAMHLPPHTRGRAIVTVHESEGTTSRFAVDFHQGRATVTTTESTPEFTCPDRVWAAIVCGDLSATRAARLGLVAAEDSRAPEVLDVFSGGPVPFCDEGF